MSEPIRPLKIRLDRPLSKLVIVWSDGTVSSYPWDFLRAHCPSAGEKAVRENRDPLAVLGAVPSTRIVDVRMIGNYAIGLTWEDGHNSGIYSWDYLLRLSEDPAVETTAVA